MIEGMHDVYEVEPGVALLVVICFLFLFFCLAVGVNVHVGEGYFSFLSFDRELSCS